MMRTLGGLVLGLFLAGIMTGVAVPLLPPDARQPRIIWLIAGVAVAASIFAVRRGRRAPPR